MTDKTDDLIAALCVAREGGLKRGECVALVHDVFQAPWTKPAEIKERVTEVCETRSFREALFGEVKAGAK